MKISQIRIENYTAFESCQIEFGEGMNVLYPLRIRL